MDGATNWTMVILPGVFLFDNPSQNFNPIQVFTSVIGKSTNKGLTPWVVFVVSSPEGSVL